MNRRHPIGPTADAALLATKAAAEVVLSDAGGIADLLGQLGDAGAAQVLADRAAELADVINPAGAASLLGAFIRLGQLRQAATFADRAAQQSELTDPRGVIELLEAMDHTVLRDGRTQLARRCIDAGFFEKANLWTPDLVTDFKFGLELDGTASPPWTWGEL